MGSSDIPTYPHPQGSDRATIADNLKRGRDRFVQALSGLDESHLGQLTPLPFGLVPTPVAVQIAVLEYGYHRWDLEHGLGDVAYALSADISLGGFEFLDGLLPMLSGAAKPPDGALAFELRSPSGSLVLEHSGEAWQPAGSPTVDAVCTIDGDVAALALFGMGRLGPADPALTISGAAEAEATRFKTYFPGP